MRKIPKQKGSKIIMNYYYIAKWHCCVIKHVNLLASHAFYQTNKLQNVLNNNLDSIESRRVLFTRIKCDKVHGESMQRQRVLGMWVISEFVYENHVRAL